ECIYEDDSENAPCAIGFKLFYGQASSRASSRTGDVWTYLRKRDDVRIIHLVRQNLLATLASLHTALLSNIWACDAETRDHQRFERVNLPVKLCKEYFDMTERDLKRAHELCSMRERSSMTLEYESDIAKNFCTTAK